MNASEVGNDDELGELLDPPELLALLELLEDRPLELLALLELALLELALLELALLELPLLELFALPLLEPLIPLLELVVLPLLEVLPLLILLEFSIDSRILFLI